jgi:prevent-host-death family protein
VTKSTKGNTGGHAASVVGVHEAKTHFSQLLARAEAGEDIEIARRGEVVARLVPVRRPGRRHLGVDEGRVTIGEDFDAPLPDELAAAFGT